MQHIPNESHIPGKNRGPHVKHRAFFISADLGQINDYTAISITERITTGYGVVGDRCLGINEYHLRHIERPPRGTEYPAIVDRLVEIYKSPQLDSVPKATVIDLTGLGRPVYDMMQKAGFSFSLNGITITGGTDITFDDGVFTVPKLDLITNLQILLQNNELKIAKGMKEAAALVEELANFQTKISDSGRDTYEARSGTHDDIVLSVAMGAWLATHHWCKFGVGKIM